MSTRTDTPRVWVGCLASYNAGRSIGEWVNATDVDEIIECRDRVAAKAVQAAKEAAEWPVYFGPPEEFYIGDYEGFGAIARELGEYPDFEQVAKIGALIEEHGEAFIAYVDACEPDLNEVTEDDFYAHYRHVWDSEEAFAQDHVGELGWGGVPAQVEVPKHPFGTESMNVFSELESYIKWDSIARELFRHGNYSSRDCESGGIHVFEDEV